MLSACDPASIRVSITNKISSTRRVKPKVGTGYMVMDFYLITVSIHLLFVHGSFADQAREKAIEILKTTPLVDGHNDLPYQIRKQFFNRIANLSLDKRSNKTQTDIPRLREGGMGAQFWAAYVGCSNQYKNAVRLVLEQIDLIYRLVEKYPNDFTFVETADQIVQAKKDGKIGSLVGVECGHCIDSSLDTLRALYQLGARYMTLTHSCHTPWADSSSKPPVHNGLTDFGKTVVKEMNRLGMFVDLSHVSPKTMKDALDTSVAPVIFSHSSAYALCNHSRNVPDDVLRRMPTNGGVVMVNFYNDFVTCKKVANLTDVADHIDHIKNVSGIDHVGLGSDYDGVPRLPTGLEDVSKFPDLLAELIRRRYSDEEIRKIAGENLIRAMKEMEKVAEQLENSRPYEDVIFVNKTCRPNFQGNYKKLKFPTDPWSFF